MINWLHAQPFLLERKLSDNITCCRWCTSMKEKFVVKLNLAGYQFDLDEHDSGNLMLEFARNPGARSGGGNRGKC